ncbi:hypothetical protein GIB67_039314, partial [Kingdonia uniflora]
FDDSEVGDLGTPISIGDLGFGNSNSHLQILRRFSGWFSYELQFPIHLQIQWLIIIKQLRFSG